MNSSRRLFFTQAAAPFVVLAQQSPQTRPPEWQANWYQVNWEREKFEKKIPTDTIYVHYTAGKTGNTWETLSQIGYQRQYETRYAISDPDPMVKGQQPYSGHFRYVNGILVQVYYAYHWLIHEDGTVESLLDDREVGWHSGSWAENLRSVAIVFDGEYAEKGPSKKAMKAAAKLIAEYCKKFPISRLRAHYQNNTEKRKTDCPGKWFDTKDHSGLTGRERLLKMAKVQLGD